MNKISPCRRPRIVNNPGLCVIVKTYQCGCFEVQDRSGFECIMLNESRRRSEIANGGSFYEPVKIYHDEANDLYSLFVGHAL